MSQSTNAERTALIMPVKGVLPTIPESCFLAPNATIVGDVVMGEECSIWFNAVVRGDVNSIRMGNRVNVQDGVCIHCTYEKPKLLLVTMYLLVIMHWFMAAQLVTTC